MYLGIVVEYGTVYDVFYGHHHPYTRGLLASMPIVSAAKRSLAPIQGSVPSASTRIQGCPFKTRCTEYMQGVCDEMPPVTHLSDDHIVRCWLYADGESANEGTVTA